MKKPKKQEEAKLVRSTIRIPRPLWNKLGHLAVDMRTSINDLVIRAVTEYAKKEAARG